MALFTAEQLASLELRVAEANKQHQREVDTLSNVMKMLNTGLSPTEVMKAVSSFPEMGEVWIDLKQRDISAAREIIACVLDGAVDDLAAMRKDDIYANPEVLDHFNKVLTNLRDGWRLIT